ncbi:MAG: transketolase [Patescibacteria group bacterium]
MAIKSQSKPTEEAMKEKANLARAYILIALHFAGSGHSGGSLSVIDIETVLYNSILKHDPADSFWAGRDRLFVSCQHKCPAQYAALGMAGYFPIKDFLIGLRAIGTPFQGHPDWLKLPGIEMSGGSLGQGMGVAVGSALAAKLNGESHRIYCITSDGEQQEGSVWEAYMSAAHYKLDNLCAILDVNGLQIDGKTCEVMNIEPITDKYRAFGWHVIDIDGHNIDALLAAFEEAKKIKGKPTMIVARTLKGKGVSFMEGVVDWHGKSPKLEELKIALKELGHEELLTEDLIKEAGAVRENIAKKYGNLIPADERPYWWNSGENMKVKMSPTRAGFGASLARIGSDERIVCLGADISSSICIYDFCKNNPERKNRFLSMGIAEQNMTVVAAGLAKEGKIPVIGSYGVFVTGRNWDQLRTTICYGNLNVKIAVGHGGISVGPDGATHQALEDLTLLTILPNMKVVVPADSIEADKATEEVVLRQVGPCAVRFAREATPIVTTQNTPFILGKANIYRFRHEAENFIDAFECIVSDKYKSEGESVCIIACGPMVPEALRAAFILKKERGIETRVINLHTLKPIDADAIMAAAKEIGKIITIEEHQKGGVGNLIAGIIAEAGIPVKMKMIGMNDTFGESGNPWELIWKYGLAAEHVAEAAKKMVEV